MKLEWLDRTALRLPRLLLCVTEEQYMRAAKSLGVAQPLPWLGAYAQAGCHTLTSEDWGIACIICIRIEKERSIECTAALLAHEVVHVKQSLFKDMGEEAPGAEIEAYVVQNALQQVLGSYIKQARR